MRRVLVTGAGSGLGHSIALAFAGCSTTETIQGGGEAGAFSKEQELHVAACVQE